MAKKTTKFIYRGDAYPSPWGHQQQLYISHLEGMIEGLTGEVIDLWHKLDDVADGCKANTDLVIRLERKVFGGTTVERANAKLLAARKKRTGRRKG